MTSSAKLSSVSRRRCVAFRERFSGPFQGGQDRSAAAPQRRQKQARNKPQPRDGRRRRRGVQTRVDRCRAPRSGALPCPLGSPSRRLTAQGASRQRGLDRGSRCRPALEWGPVILSAASSCLERQHQMGTYRCGAGSRADGDTPSVAQNPSALSPDREHRGAHATPFRVAHQVGPALARFPVTVGEGDQLLDAVDAHADEHQRQKLVLAEAKSAWMPSAPGPPPRRRGPRLRLVEPGH